jgi:hypothetical protein
MTLQSNPNRIRTNVGENNLRIVEDRKHFKTSRFNGRSNAKRVQTRGGVRG